MPSKQLHVSKKWSKVSSPFPQRRHIGFSWDLLNEALFAYKCKRVLNLWSQTSGRIHIMKNKAGKENMKQNINITPLGASGFSSWWISTISEVCNLYSSLKYLKGSYKIALCARMPSKQLHVSKKWSKVSSPFPQRRHIGFSWDLLNEALFAYKMYVPVAIFRRIGILIISLMLTLIVVARGWHRAIL
jgi:hypothetical protein